MTDKQYEKDDLVMLNEAAAEAVSEKLLTAKLTGNQAEFKILDNPIGSGASSTVYDAIRTDGSGGRIRLKRLRGVGPAVENRFLRAIQLQHRLMESNNSIAPLTGLYRGTDQHLWSSHTLMHGETYERVKEKDIRDVLRHVDSLARAVQAFHEEGYLCLDIAPANVYLMKSGSIEGVAVLDCNSFVVYNGAVKHGELISTTEKYGAPEVRQGRISKIAPAADVYSIGMILFEKLFGRLPDIITEHLVFSQMPFDELKCIPEGKTLTVEIKTELEDFFHHTICTSVEKRFKSVDKVVMALEKMSKLAEADLQRRPRLAKESIHPVSESFVPRHELLNLMEDAFRRGTKCVILQADVGGAGKSELARSYAETYCEKLDSSVFTVWDASCKSYETLVEQLNITDGFSAEDRQDCMDRLRPADLIILDNCDAVELEEVQVFKNLLRRSGAARIIITTRRAQLAEILSEEYGVETIEVFNGSGLAYNIIRQAIRVMNGPGVAADMIREWLEGENGKALEHILSSIEYHPYMTDLIAREMIMYRLNPVKICRMMTKGLTESPEGAEIKTDKDGTRKTDSIKNHIRYLFSDVLDHTFSDAEKKLLILLSRKPACYLDEEKICQIVGDDDEHKLAQAAANRLVHRSWLKRQRQDGIWKISIHPLLAEMLREVLKDGEEYSRLFVRNYCTLPPMDDELNGTNRILYYMVDHYVLVHSKNFDALPQIRFQDHLDFVLRLHNTAFHEKVYDHRRVSYVMKMFADDHKTERKLTGTAVFGSSCLDETTEYWMYLSEPNITVRYLNLTRGYELKERDWESENIIPVEKEARPGEMDTIWRVCAFDESDEEFDLKKMNEHPVLNSLTIDITGLVRCSHDGETTRSSLKRRIQNLKRFIQGEPLREGIFIDKPFRGGFTPENILRVEAYAFRKLQHLKTVKLPDTVETVDHHAFSDCSGLEQVELNVKTIGRRAFEDCRQLMDINLPEVEKMGIFTFAGCSNLKTVTLSAALREIPDKCFCGSKALETFELPEESVCKRIGDFAFMDSGLKKISIPESVTEIDEFAFSGAEIEEVDLPCSLELIGEHAFFQCSENLEFHVPMDDLLDDLKEPDTQQGQAALQKLLDRHQALLRYKLLEAADNVNWSVEDVEIAFRRRFPWKLLLPKHSPDDPWTEWLLRAYLGLCIESHVDHLMAMAIPEYKPKYYDELVWESKKEFRTE
ncbi:MAG: leucine-rich repeat protein [Eubacteriales bacterium]|nr:leucine-rich repeat protein [Eubacteriales bacterium]